MNMAYKLYNYITQQTCATADIVHNEVTYVMHYYKYWEPFYSQFCYYFYHYFFTISSIKSNVVLTGGVIFHSTWAPLVRNKYNT